VKAHLLYEARDLDFDAELPPNHEDLISDLNLATVLDAMATGDKFLFEVAKRVVLTSLATPQEILYRQDVLTDCIDCPETIREMYAIAGEALADKRGIWGLSARRPASILSGAVNQLEAYLVPLKRLRGIADEYASRFHSAGLTRLCATLQGELDDEYFQEINGHLKQLRFRDGTLLSARLGSDNSGIDYVLRSRDRGRSRWKERLGLEPRSAYSFTIPPRDEAGAEALDELRSRGLNLVANAAARSADHIKSYFALLRAELGFYVGCLNLREALAARHEPTVFPVPEPWHQRTLSCAGLCDASLALRTEDEVVGNDVDASGMPLVIITGANSGGKSTFLRSVGLAQLMTQAGMFVVARSYRACVFEGVFTHFLREEDATMERGRLDEELSRMSVTADRIGPRCLMLFNESFAATNEREGSEIGRQVVHALLETDVTVFFVTHQFDFAESFQTQHAEKAFFLRAERERTFKLVTAGPLSTSFGEDLYYRLGDWLDRSVADTAGS
jgi:hypothetical protein